MGWPFCNKHQGTFPERRWEYFERAEKAGASDIATLFNTGVVLMSQGRLENALGYFQRVLDRGIDFGPGWYLSAEYRTSRLLRRLGRAEEAKRVLSRWQEHRKAVGRASPDGCHAGARAAGRSPRSRPRLRLRAGR